jgi:DDE superfamily endonuclease/CENP-B N-terminal DNA-binding domain
VATVWATAPAAAVSAASAAAAAAASTDPVSAAAAAATGVAAATAAASDPVNAATGVAAAVDGTTDLTEDELQRLTVSELKTLIKAKQIAVRGGSRKKAVLIAAILSDREGLHSDSPRVRLPPALTSSAAAVLNVGEVSESERAEAMTKFYQNPHMAMIMNHSINIFTSSPPTTPRSLSLSSASTSSLQSPPTPPMLSAQEEFKNDILAVPANIAADSAPQRIIGSSVQRPKKRKRATSTSTNVAIDSQPAVRNSLDERLEQEATGRRVRASYTIENKLDIFTLLDSGMTRAALRRRYGIPKSTLTQIMSDRDHVIESAQFMTPDAIATRTHQGNRAKLHPVIETCIARFLSHTENDAKFSRQDAARIADMARVQILAIFSSIEPLTQQLTAARSVLVDFKFSRMWLDRVLHERNIEVLKLHGEGGSVSDMEVRCARMAITKALEEMFPPEDWYGADESALFYRRLPRGGRIVQKGRKETARGDKEPKDRLTFLLTTNVTGDDRFKLLAINKSENPRNDAVLDANILWYSGKKAWMTGAIFQQYLLAFNEHIRLTKGRRVGLIIDNASSHNVVYSMRLSHVMVMFLPPNMTSHLQSADAGIIYSLKQRYLAQVGVLRADRLMRSAAEFTVTPKQATNLLNMQ